MEKRKKKFYGALAALFGFWLCVLIVFQSFEVVEEIIKIFK